MALCLLVVMGGLASIFVLNITYTLSFFHKQLKSQTAFNLAEAGIESAVWNLSRPKSEYQGESDTRLGEGTFTVTVEKSEAGAGRVKVISRGFYPDSSSPQSECTLMAVLDVRAGVRVLLWKQIPSGKINKFKGVSKGGILTAEDAAILAVKLANDECQRLYRERPFTPDLYQAELRGTIWHWGHLDPAGVNGFSAKVSFLQDISNPKVEVYYSTDKLQRPKLPVRPDEEDIKDLMIDRVR